LPDLFRRQAIDFQRQKFHGAIVLTRSPWRTAVAAGFALLVGGLVAFAATQGFARKETVAGVLLPSSGVLRLVAPQAGVVLDGGPAQGHEVRAGEVVARLSNDLSSAAGPTQALVARTLETRQTALQDELRRQGEQARQQAGVLDARAASLAASIEEQDRQVALQRERVRVARDIADRYPDLVRTGAVSPVEAAEKKDEVLDQQAHLATLEQARLATQRELAAVRADRAALPLQAGREGSQLQREMQAIAQQQAEAESRRETVVTAPQAGRVAARLVPAGQAVSAGQAIATVLPDGATLEAELFVPSRAAGFVQPGTPVWLRVDAFPYARFGQLPGHVREVSQSAVSTADLDPATPAGEAVAATPGVYRVRVVLDTVHGIDLAASSGSNAAAANGEAALDWSRALKPGMRVQASLVAEKRTLLAWAFEPLAALRVAAADRPEPAPAAPAATR
jgi:membrane fusion protein